MLGYFFDPAERAAGGAAGQPARAARRARARDRRRGWRRSNVLVDVDSVLLAAAARPGSSVGRPQLARELVRAGHVASVQEAFDRWLATGQPGVRAAHRAQSRRR